MKVSKTDTMLAALSMVLLGVSFHFGLLLYGGIAVYLIMGGAFLAHIIAIRSRIERSLPAFGIVTGFDTQSRGKQVFPVVEYTTELGEEIKAVSQLCDREERYLAGAEEMICYDPRDPQFFYFSGQEDQLTRGYFRFLVFGGVIAVALFITAQVLR
ncbi:MAG: hypothetical protein IJ071_05355 [Ruminococcus sp.]|nr:hypothetical protein [Ruminococcus sp.]